MYIMAAIEKINLFEKNHDYINAIINIFMYKTILITNKLCIYHLKLLFLVILKGFDSIGLKARVKCA